LQENHLPLSFPFYFNLNSLSTTHWTTTGELFKQPILLDYQQPMVAILTGLKKQMHGIMHLQPVEIKTDKE